jgi:putative MATE family efflux protein
MNTSAANAMAGRTRDLLHAPLLPTLLRLATPNIIGLFATTVVIGYDGYILGRLGADALAGVALVFPLSMLMLQMSAGGIGGAVSAAVARALGGGSSHEANRLAQQALLLAFALAALFALVMLTSGSAIYGAMGGKAAALHAAMAYSNVLFGGALVIWLTNILAAIVRGAGNMLLPSLMLTAIAAVHLLLCPLLVFGWGPLTGLGVAGAAVSTLCTNALAAAVLAAHLIRSKGPVQLCHAGWRPQRDLLRVILRVGAPASLSPVLSNGSIAAATALIGSYGTAALAGFGVAARLEYIMVPIAFGFGTALTTLVATNMGAGQHARALRATWSGSVVVGAITGAIGITAAIQPALWMNYFSSDPAVLAFGSAYLHVVGTCYGLFGFGLALFFASQGAGRMFWPLAGSVARLVVVALGGWIAVQVLRLPVQGFFFIIAAGFAVYALTIAAPIGLGSWARH